MYLMGYSINVLSLAGLALSIGMIVDDAIVVLENIFRHRYEEGKSIVRACVDGTREVGMAVLMSTLTTAAVFMPVLMLTGEVGTLFGPVAFIISVAIFLSLFDAFTVVPMLASRWMKQRERTQGVVETNHVSSRLSGQGRWKSLRRLISTLRYFLGERSAKSSLGHHRACTFRFIILGIAWYGISSHRRNEPHKSTDRSGRRNQSGRE